MENVFMNGLEGRTIEDAALAIYSLEEFFPNLDYYEIVIADANDQSDNIVLTRHDINGYIEKISKIKDKLLFMAASTFSIEKQATIYLLYYK